MIYTKTKPTGIDVAIQKAQTKLYDKLSNIWGVDLEAYGRAYLLKRGDITVPEVFVGGTDYEDVLGVDSNKFFFVASNESSKLSNTRYETDVDIYFILDLSNIKIDVEHRADEEVHKDVDYVLNMTDFDVLNIQTGIDNVLKDFNISDRDNFNYADFEPYHIFKFECNVNYNLKTTKCNG